MITDKELWLSNKSYVNKDFQTIFPELLDLTQKLTSKWNPSTSNESDPGVVLLKLLAFIADKNNYNIDKNVLENFMPSATQYSSMQKLCELGGYELRYYNSSVADISMLYVGNLDNEKGEFLNFPKYTQLSNASNTVVFTLTKSINIGISNNEYTSSIIQGLIKTLTIGDSKNIQLTNIDENYRIYFPDKLVAQNGVFVYNYEEDVPYNEGEEWTKTFNLNTASEGSKVFKFGFDSQLELPYIEFPNDIASLIGNGLSIRYVVSLGEQGNITSGEITSLYNATSYPIYWYEEDVLKSRQETVSNNYLRIINYFPTTSGENPESVDQAFNSFKKYVGTFETLVTPRDYANYIYRMLDKEMSIVSNVQVTDRRVDMNLATDIISFGVGGTHTEHIDSTDITPFDLYLYAFRPVTSEFSISAYNNSFKPLQASSLNKIVQYLEEDNDSSLACISHNYKVIPNEVQVGSNINNVFAYKNYLYLNVKVATKNKVNEFEEDAILSNIKGALCKKFNAREVNFGYEIPYDLLLRTIEEADARIKYVTLDEPILNTKVLRDTELSVETLLFPTNLTNATVSDYNDYIFLLSKNILAGKISLFEYDEDFRYDFGQELITNKGPKFENIKAIGTETLIANNEFTNSFYTLKNNEIVQFIAPNFQTEITYESGVQFEFSQALPNGTTIIKLEGDDELKCYSHDLEGSSILEIYTSDTIVKKVNDITTNTKTVPLNSFRISLTSSVKASELTTLKAQEKVEKISTISTSITNPQFRCIWKVNQLNNILFNGQSFPQERILTSGEYFIYPNKQGTGLTILGAGTRLIYNGIDSWEMSPAKFDASSISNYGVESIDTVQWYVKNLSNGNYLNIQEMSIISLGEGDSFKIDTFSEDVSNILQSIQSSFYYKLGDGEIVTVLSPIGIDEWKVRSRLDLLCGPNLPQSLEDNHTITLYFDDNTEEELEGPAFLKTNNLITSAGGELVDVQITTLFDSTPRSLLKALYYDFNPVIINDELLQLRADDMYTISLADIYNSTNNPLILSTIAMPNEKRLFTLFYRKIDSIVDSLEISTNLTTENALREFNKYNNQSLVSFEPSLEISSSGLYIIELNETLDISEITIKVNYIQDAPTNTQDSILLSNPTLVKGINKRFNLENTSIQASLETALLEKISDLSNDKFYYLNKTNNLKAIEIEDLSSPYALYDYNNVANRTTISQIDFDSSTIEIIRSSRLRGR